MRTTYEDPIPYPIRRARGQFATPTPVVELVTCLAVDHHTFKVLDPACGTGNFLSKAVEVISELQPNHERQQARRENQLWGVEVDPDRAELARNALSSLHGPRVRILTADFLRIQPQSVHTRAAAPDVGSLETWLPNDFDVILSNPPYTEYREVGRRELSSEKTVFTERLDRRAALYAHFLNHATRFLKQQGILVFVLPDGWMESRWGIRLRKFILDNFMICSFITFDKDIFPDAMVEASIVVLRKVTGHQNASVRNNSRVAFLRLKTVVDIKEILRILGMYKDVEEHEFRLVHRIQRELHVEKAWTTYTRQMICCSLLAGKTKVAPLSEVAHIRYSMKEGGYSFFILSKRKLERWKIEPKFLAPILSSPSKISFLDVKQGEVDERLFRVAEPRKRLAGTNALQYIKYGERQKVTIKKGRLRGKSVLGYHSLQTFRDKPQWYTVKTAAPSVILVPAFVRNRFIAFWNKPRLDATANFYGIEPLNEDHTLPLLAYLNSALASCLVEEIGKTSMGRGLLDIRAYALRNMPILDPRKQTAAENLALSERFTRLSWAMRHAEQAEIERARENLDDQVFKSLGLARNRETILRTLMYTKQLRLDRLRPDILIQHVEDSGRLSRESTMNPLEYTLPQESRLVGGTFRPGAGITKKEISAQQRSVSAGATSLPSCSSPV